MSYFLTAFGVIGVVWLVVSLAEAREQMERWERIYRDQLKTLAWILLLPLATDAQPFTNPTGEPIGGGSGYSRTVDTSGAILVRTAQDLQLALEAALPGDVVYITRDIDATGYQYTVPGGVTVASDRSAIVSTSDIYPNNTYQGLFQTGGPDVRFTGVRLKGPTSHTGDHNYDAHGVSNAIRGKYGTLEVDNCELWGWDKWAIDLEIADGDHIHHNFFHHNHRAGYGYGVWVRSSGTMNPPNEIPLIEANLFDAQRHHIAAGSQATGSYEARYNVFLPRATGHQVDRHGNATKAGLRTDVHHNWFVGSGRAFAVRGAPLDTARFANNWTAALDAASAVRFDHPSARTVEIGNHYNYHDQGPVPMIAARRKHVDATGPFSAYLWRIPATDPAGRYEWGDRIKLAAEPGRYTVEVIGWDADGIPHRAFTPVYVHPRHNAFTAWIEDTYRGDEEGDYAVQVLIEGAVQWEDDLAGDEGWRRVLVDLTPYETAVEIEIRLLALRDVDREVFVRVDDAHVFGGYIGDGGFETGGIWRLKGQNTTGQSWSTTYSGAANGGDRSWQMGKTTSRKQTNAGDFVSVYQTAQLNRKATREAVAADVIPAGVTMDVYDVMGRLVRRSVHTLDGLPPGLYIARTGKITRLVWH